MSRILSAIVMAICITGTAHALTTIPPDHRHLPGPGPGPSATPAPEIDPAGAFAALTLLAGGIAVVRGRRAKK